MAPTSFFASPTPLLRSFLSPHLSTLCRFHCAIAPRHRLRRGHEPHTQLCVGSAADESSSVLVIATSQGKWTGCGPVSAVGISA